MKILVISNLYPPHGIGGYEERCMHTVNDLRKRGHAVHVLTSDHSVEGRNASGETDITRKLRVHGFYGHPWLAVHKLYSLEKYNQATLCEQLNEFKPDVVHVWNMGGITKSLLHTLESGPHPLVYDISDHWIARSLKADVWLSWWNAPGSAARNFLCALATISGIRKLISIKVPTASVRDLKFKQIYFCSTYMRDTTQQKGYPVGHADIIYCGVEAERFDKKLTFSPVKKFIWVGRLSEDKDPLTTLRGFIKARKACGLDLTLDIYGSGEQGFVNVIKAEIAAAGANDFVQIKSATHDEMRGLYAAYDAYIFSSNWGEPFALTPLEAMASGTPVIMCPDGGDAELLEDGTNALAFEAANPESLALAIERLLKLEDHGEAMCQNAFETVHRRFTVNVVTDQIEEVLQRAADRHV